MTPIYENHITVAREPADAALPVEWHRFIATCEGFGLKALWIENLHVQTITSPTTFAQLDVITTANQEFITQSVSRGTYQEALEQLEYHSFGLMANGYNVIRAKIEVAPWDPMVPTEEQWIPTAPSPNYFETHIKLPQLDTETQQKEMLRLVRNRGAHISRSVPKGTSIATLRDHNLTLQGFQYIVDQFITSLARYDLGRADIEYAVYDTNPDLDNEWMKL